MKFGKYKGETLKGTWTISYKIDGVRVHVENGAAKSRAGKELYNLPKLADGVYECFLGDFATTISAVRTHIGEIVPEECLYSLKPLDERLVCTIQDYLDELSVDYFFEKALADGYEGLVLHGPNGKMLKVKKHETHDLVVTGIQKGTGKYEGMMGALLTAKGKVGTGFTDDMRREFNTEEMIGKTIEVGCMEVTKYGILRHPAFIRVREDK